MTADPTTPGWYDDPTDRRSFRFFDGNHWTASTSPKYVSRENGRHAPPVVALTSAQDGSRSVMVQPVSPAVSDPQPDHYVNEIYAVHFRGGWAALFGGNSQAKQVRRALAEINRSGRRVTGSVPDAWGFWKTFWMSFLAVFSFGFYVRRPDVLLITERPPRSFSDSQLTAGPRDREFYLPAAQ